MSFYGETALAIRMLQDLCRAQQVLIVASVIDDVDAAIAKATA